MSSGQTSMASGEHFVVASMDRLAASPFSVERTARIIFEALSLVNQRAASRPVFRSFFSEGCNERLESERGLPSPTLDPVTMTVFPA